MRAGRRRVLCAVLAVCAAMAVAPVGAPEVGAQDAGPAATPVVHTPVPRPGEVVAAAAVTEVSARVRSGGPVRTARLLVDGQPAQELAVGAADAAGDVVVRGALPLPAGSHVASLTVEDAAGRRSERSWSFSAAEATVERVAGDTRFDTAVEVSTVTFPDDGSARGAVIARADDFADALAGVPLAAAVDGPLLLAAPDGMPPATAAELRRVLAPGAVVHLLGGEAALGAAVVRDVEALGLRVVRHAGRDRFGTAAAVARELPPSDGAIVASAGSFPDALAASVPAARDGLPILLTTPDAVPESTTAVLVDRAPQLVTIVGGTGVVGPRVEQRIGDLAATVRRVAGDDRYGTAAAVLDAFFPAPQSGISLASGIAFPDALAGAARAATLREPLLLTPDRALSPYAAHPLRVHRPRKVTVYGGGAAVDDAVAAAALRATVDGPETPRVVATIPLAQEAVTLLEEVSVTFDRPVDPASSSVYVEVAGVELPGAVEELGPTPTLTVRVPPGLPALPPGATAVGRVVVAATGESGGVAHEDWTFVYTAVDPVFARAGEVALHLPSRRVEMVGFHQSGHDGARQLEVGASAVPTTTLSSRGRGTGSRTAADVVAEPGVAVVAPVTGRVLRSGSYTLYCDHTDQYAVIEPDARPGWEVKVLHFEGLQVRPGDRVVASATVLGTGPRMLPFPSQVDDVSERGWPHVHIEVVDPSVPDRPGSGC